MRDDAYVWIPHLFFFSFLISMTALSCFSGVNAPISHFALMFSIPPPVLTSYVPFALVG